jgi:hypothetical protein
MRKNSYIRGLTESQTLGYVLSAITWVCPVPYLLHTSIPALRSSAAAAGRSAPILVAHVPVALSEDRTSFCQQDIDFLIFTPYSMPTCFLMQGSK